MRSLLVFMTVATLATPVLLLFGSSAVLVAVLCGVFDLAFVVALGTAAVYSRGPRRTFFAGACAAAVIGALRYDGFRTPDLTMQLAATAVLTPCYLACGVIAVAVRRLAVHRGWNKPESPTETDASAASPRPAAEEAVLRVLDV